MIVALSRTILLLSFTTALSSFGQNLPDHLASAPRLVNATKRNSIAPTTKNVGKIEADDPVITIHGVCPASSSEEQADRYACATVVTRQQFESLLNAANVSGQYVSNAARQNMAEGYVTFLAFEQAARKAGFEDTPQFEEIMRWARLRAITEAYRGKIVEEARTATQSEVDAYYKSHISLFGRIDVICLAVPSGNPAASNELEFGRRAQLAAQNMRERLIKGDDPETIQNDAYAALGLPGVQPVDIGTRKTSMFPREESEELFSLAPGQVSRVETETSRYAIYKVTDNRPIEEAKVQDQIVRAVGEEKVKAAFKSIGNSVKPEYNLIYFGSAQPLSSPH
jgi:hypothetical protein